MGNNLTTTEYRQLWDMNPLVVCKLSHKTEPSQTIRFDFQKQTQVQKLIQQYEWFIDDIKFIER